MRSRSTQAPYLLAALKPYVVTQQLETGKKFFFSTFDPVDLGAASDQHRHRRSRADQNRQSFGTGDQVAPKLSRHLGAVSGVDGHGRTLKEESPAGMSLAAAKRRRRRRNSAVPSRRARYDCANVNSRSQTDCQPIVERFRALELKLSGVNLANFSPSTADGKRLRAINLAIPRWKSPPRRAEQRLPVKDSASADFLQPTAVPAIRSSAYPNTGGENFDGETDAERAALKLKDWVYREIAKEPTVSIPNALQVLESKKGDCNEHTVLFNALARAAGIPAKTVVGVVYLRGAFFYHAWSEVWLGRVDFPRLGAQSIPRPRDPCQISRRRNRPADRSAATDWQSQNRSLMNRSSFWIFDCAILDSRIGTPVSIQNPQSKIPQIPKSHDSNHQPDQALRQTRRSG